MIAGLAMYDTIHHIRSEVITINVGLAASMASFILAAGAKVPVDADVCIANVPAGVVAASAAEMCDKRLRWRRTQKETWKTYC